MPTLTTYATVPHSPTLMLRDKGCWWPKWLKPSPTSYCHQHISSPTSVTNLDVAPIVYQKIISTIMKSHAWMISFLIVETYSIPLWTSNSNDAKALLTSILNSFISSDGTISFDNLDSIPARRSSKISKRSASELIWSWICFRWHFAIPISNAYMGFPLESCFWPA